MTELSIAASVAQELKEKGIADTPTPVEFDALKLSITSRGLKQWYGTYDNGIKEVMKAFERLTIDNVVALEVADDELDQAIADWQQDMREADI
jgi:hypothetical protein